MEDSGLQCEIYFVDKNAFDKMKSIFYQYHFNSSARDLSVLIAQNIYHRYFPKSKKIQTNISWLDIIFCHTNSDKNM